MSSGTSNDRKENVISLLICISGYIVSRIISSSINETQSYFYKFVTFPPIDLLFVHSPNRCIKNDTECMKHYLLLMNDELGKSKFTNFMLTHFYQK